MDQSTRHDDEQVDAIYDQISSEPANDEQRTFRLVWDAATLIGRGGFESLFEQSPTLEEYRSAFLKVGMPEAAALFGQLLASIPSDLRTADQDERLFQYLTSKFEELKALSHRFYDVTPDWPTLLLRFVYQHPNQFPVA